MKRYWIMLLAAFAVWFSSVQAANYVQWISSVDAGEIRWWGSTKYTIPLLNSIATWNARGKVNIAPDTATTLEDVTLSDVNLSNVIWNWRWTYSAYFSSPIEFNTYYLDLVSASRKQNTITHEFWHALGLAHSVTNNIMYTTQTSLTALWTQDIADYTYIYGK